MSDHKQETAFRVIDRRPFTAEGELRHEAVEEEQREARKEAATQDCLLYTSDAADE